MSDGVRLVSLSLQDVGGLDERIDLGPFGGGVSVISGQRRPERATLVAAVRAALFEPRDERHEGIKALQAPGTQSGPEIWIELTLDGERVRVHKRFLEMPLAEVRLHRDGAVVTGSAADEVLLARLPVGAGGPGGDQGTNVEDPVATALDLAALHAELTARIGELEGELPALEREWKAAVAAESRAHELERAAQDTEFQLAGAEALLDAVHCEVAARAALASEAEALGSEIESVELSALPETRRRCAVILETLAGLRRIEPDAVLKARHASAIAALLPAHRSARRAAAALDEVTPQLLSGDTLRARGAINACARRTAELRGKVLAVKAWMDRTALGPHLEELAAAPSVLDFGWLADRAREQLAVVVRLSVARMITANKTPLPLFLDDTLGWNDDGRFLSMVQILRQTPGAPQIIVLTGHPSRFNRLDVEYTVDLDQLRDERRRALGLDRISG